MLRPGSKKTDLTCALLVCLESGVGALFDLIPRIIPTTSFARSSCTLELSRYDGTREIRVKIISVPWGNKGEKISEI
jgi:hypothetical protein